jgi:hypothetical protein
MPVPVIEFLGGSISHGTMRPCDLLPAFMGLLEAIMTKEEWHSFWKENEEVLDKIAPEGVYLIEDDSAYQADLWNSDEVAFFLNERLFDALNERAPDGYRFGAHDGDGSDYGFWLSEAEEDTNGGPDGLENEETDRNGGLMNHELPAEVRPAGPGDEGFIPPRYVLNLWAALTDCISRDVGPPLAVVAEMLRQDAEASNNTCTRTGLAVTWLESLGYVRDVLKAKGL